MKHTGVAYALWFDHAHIALMGVEPSAKLLRYAAVTDVSDGWCIVDISGPEVRDVLARVTPLDMRIKSFKTGMTQRSMLMHMQASISCLGKSHFRVMVFRSMALTVVHDLAVAMESVAVRRQKV
jgi:heterotetrameric sarcosine oxidase gamma subunit